MKSQAQQVTFELHTLGWRAFQDLCFTILREEFGHKCQLLSYVKDLGQDIIYTGESSLESNLTELFIIQCKHRSKPDISLTVGMFTEEVAKLKALSKVKHIRNYYIVTNMIVAGEAELNIRERIQTECNIPNVLIYGKDWLDRTTLESRRLRQLVPRIYGLGDLSQILDARAYQQSIEILGLMGDELSKFVITDAYRKSVKALSEKNVVLLLGEPMAGKTTIAAFLCMSMIDEGSFNFIQVNDLYELKKHWNPNERQLFWIDDVFGATRYNEEKSEEFNKLFMYLSGLIQKGSKVILTSRTYIFHQAQKHLKSGVAQIFSDSQVVIHVSDLTSDEKQYLLYNHLKYGNQDKSFKTKIKPLLDDVVKNQEILPEIARRLGNRIYTKNLSISESGLKEFINKPIDYLYDTISSLSEESIAAMILVFSHANKLPSPVKLTQTDKEMLELLTSNASRAVQMLQVLRDDFLLLTQGNERNWRFKHPTLMEAVAKHLSKNPELLDVYIKHAPLSIVLNDIACIGALRSSNRLILPESLYGDLLDRLDLDDNLQIRDKLFSFLAYHTDNDFIRLYKIKYPRFIKRNYFPLRELERHPLVIISKVLYKEGMLDDVDIFEINEFISECSLDYPDIYILKDDKLQEVIGLDNFTLLQKQIIDEVANDYVRQIDCWFDMYQYEDPSEADYYMDDLIKLYSELQDIYSTNEEVYSATESAMELIRTKIVDKHEEIEYYQARRAEEMYDSWKDRGCNVSQVSPDSSSVFSDLDS